MNGAVPRAPAPLDVCGHDAVRGRARRRRGRSPGGPGALAGRSTPVPRDGGDDRGRTQAAAGGGQAAAGHRTGADRGAAEVPGTGAGRTARPVRGGAEPAGAAHGPPGADRVDGDGPGRRPLRRAGRAGRGRPEPGAVRPHGPVAAAEGPAGRCGPAPRAGPARASDHPSGTPARRRHRRPPEEGLERLARVAAANAARSLDDLVRALADRHPSDGHDDMAVLAVRTPE